MNLLKKNKYSIRKYKVGIFSTLIGIVLLLSNPNGAQALTTDNNVQSDTNQATPVNSQDKDVANNRGLANSAQNTLINLQQPIKQRIKHWLIIIMVVQ